MRHWRPRSSGQPRTTICGVGAERTQQLQLELALIGQTAETRARILALVRAEQDIRRLGLEGQAADEARQRELMNTELARQVRAQSDAWAQFQQAGESAIDGSSTSCAAVISGVRWPRCWASWKRASSIFRSAIR